MKKLLFTLAIVLSCCSNAFSQATLLTVDCQNPGWLSSKIGYGDQQTVTDLTVTGYVNYDDLEFIGTLMKLHSLKRLDLEQVEVVSSNVEMQNTLPIDMFKIDWNEECHLEKIVLPLSIKKIMQSSTSGCLSNWLYVDTLVIGGPAMPIIENSVYKTGGLGSRVKKLIIREGVESIANNCFYYNGDEAKIENVILPSSLKIIGDRAFYGNKFTSLDLPNSIEEIGMNAFTSGSSENTWKPDTLFLPTSIKKFNFSAFNAPSKVYYFPEGIDYLDNLGRPYQSLQDFITLDDHVEIHIKATTPPNFNYNSFNCLLNSVVYVPKGTYSQYNNTTPWKQSTIIEEIPVESISLEKEKILHVGDKTKLQAQILPTDATNKKVKWESSNPEIVEVSEDGTIQAIKYGTAEITATTIDGGYDASCIVTVYEHTKRVEMIDKISLPIDNTYALNAKTLPLNTSDNNITYKSDNNEIATVNNQGIVTGKKKGTCTITATSVDGGYTATCEVTVTQPVEALTLEKHTASLKVGDTEKLFAQITPATADNKEVEWSSSNKQVATVDASGNVTALKSGEAWIKAISKDNTEAKDSCKVTVTQPVTGITLSQESCRLTNIGETIQLEATVLPEEASNKDVKWTSTNEAVCIVANGKIVATGFGTAVVIATTIDGGFMATCTVVVEKETVPVSEIILSQTSVELSKGETFQLTATVLPTDATNKTLTWKSSDESVCVTTQTGTLIAMNDGNAVITVTSENGTVKAQCNVKVGNGDGIDNVEIDNNDVKYITINGMYTEELKPGLNIIRMKDGTTRKVMVK